VFAILTHAVFYTNHEGVAYEL